MTVAKVWGDHDWDMSDADDDLRFVRCAPSREKWTVAHNEVRGDDFVVVCYRLTEDTSAPAPEFARWVGGLMNEAEK